MQAERATRESEQGPAPERAVRSDAPLPLGAPLVTLGEPLQTGVRAPLERSLGTDLGAVRVHSDAGSAALAESAGARAFAYGSHVFLGARESASNLPLVAHEVAHVLQQGNAPRVRLFGGGLPDRFEAEADRVSAAVQGGQPATVRERTGGPSPQFSLLGRIVSGARAVAGAVASGISDLAAGARDRVLGFIRDRARSIPGYDLLGVILGRDPISRQPVERNAVNLIRGFLGLIPGGAQMFANLQRSGAIERAYNWFTAEIARLNLTWDAITALFRRAWDALSASDFLNPSGAWEKIRGVFGPPLTRIRNFAVAAGRQVLEFVFEGVIMLAGGTGVLSILRRARAAFSAIVGDPIGFIRNLVQAVRGGFQRFRTNIITHLRNGLIGWLVGALAGGGIRLPRSFTDIRGIVNMVLDILGLTYARLRSILVRLIGERAVAYVEGVFDFLKTIVTQGLSAAWEKIMEFAGNLGEMVLGGVRDWVARTIVGQAIIRLVSMFNPAGAIIQAIMAIYNTVMFFVERARQIAALASAVFDSVTSIASGAIGAAVNYIEQSMGRAVPVLISFLARLIGLGGISNQIRNIIQRIQAPIARALDRVANFIVARVRGLIARLTGGGEAAAGARDPNAIAGQARRLATSELRTARDRAAAIPIIAGIERRLQVQGLRRIEVGPERDGETTVYGEINPRLPLFKLLAPGDIPAGRTVTLIARLTLWRPVRQRVEELPAVEPSATTRRSGLASEPGRGGIVIPDPRPRFVREIDVVTWNTANFNQRSNTSHAERQFIEWLGRPANAGLRASISEMDVQLRSYSPCGMCADNLIGAIRQVKADRDALRQDAAVAAAMPAGLTAHLRWSTVYPGNRSGNPGTNAAHLRELQGAGWTLHGPAPEGQAGEPALRIVST